MRRGSMISKYVENTVVEIQTLDFLDFSWLFLVSLWLSLENRINFQTLGEIYTFLIILRSRTCWVMFCYYFPSVHHLLGFHCCSI